MKDIDAMSASNHDSEGDGPEEVSTYKERDRVYQAFNSSIPSV